MRKITELVKNEEGQALVLFALLIVVLMGFASLAIDVGNLYFTKAQLQKTADAAALAGAQDLPDSGNGIPESTAISYANINGMQTPNIIVNGSPATSNIANPTYTIKINTPYMGDTCKIEVVCTKNVQNYFAGILSSELRTTIVSASAVAASRWNGCTIPLLNVRQYSDMSGLQLWDKQSDGYFESIDSSEYSGMPPNEDLMVKYSDGIKISNGKVATVKQVLDPLWSEKQNKTVYILSLSTTCIASGKVHFTIDGVNPITTDIITPSAGWCYITDLNKHNNDIIWPGDLVLLECTWTDYDGKNLIVSYSGKSYDVLKGEIPTDRPNLGGGKLIQ